MVCGCAAWPPLPVMRMSQRSAAASSGPGRDTIWPSGTPGLLWIANTASQGNFSNRPSSIIALPPPPPSSAGWKMKCTAPSKSRFSLSTLAAPSSMAVWPSWPQACMRPGFCERCSKSFVSSIGRQSMSARRPIDFNELPLRRVPTRPVLPRPRVTSRPHSVQLGGDDVGGAVLLVGELGMGMDVAADGGDLALDLEGTRQDGHELLRVEAIMAATLAGEAAPKRDRSSPPA